MLLDRLRHLSMSTSKQTNATAEHEAAVDLLVLTAYADGRVDQVELESLDAFDADHADWDEGAFSVAQYLPVSLAKVRATLGDEAATDALITASAAAITTPILKAETLAACAALTGVNGVDAAESAFLDQLRTAIG